MDDLRPLDGAEGSATGVPGGASTPADGGAPVPAQEAQEADAATGQAAPVAAAAPVANPAVLAAEAHAAMLAEAARAARAAAAAATEDEISPEALGPDRWSDGIDRMHAVARQGRQVARVSMSFSVVTMATAVANSILAVMVPGSGAAGAVGGAVTALMVLKVVLTYFAPIWSTTAIITGICCTFVAAAIAGGAAERAALLERERSREIARQESALRVRRRAEARERARMEAEAAEAAAAARRLREAETIAARAGERAEEERQRAEAATAREQNLAARSEDLDRKHRADLAILSGRQSVSMTLIG